MILTRLRCVVTLTTIAILFTFWKTTKVTTRVSDAAELQIHGVDTLPFTNQVRPQRRWPARLLRIVRSSSLKESLTNSSVGKRFFPHNFIEHATNKKQSVAELFDTFKVGTVDVDGFFSNRHFKKWEKAVRESFGDDAETVMLSTMSTKLHGDTNGGVEAIIAQAIKHKETEKLALRFETLLLQGMVDGVKKNNFDATSEFVRYAIYRGSGQSAVIKKMQKLMGNDKVTTHINTFEEAVAKASLNSIERLENYFVIISRGQRISDVFENLGPAEKFNNNAFLMNLLQEKAADPKIKVNFVEFMLSQLREAKRTDDEIAKTLQQLKKQEISSDIKDKLLDPMTEALAKSKPLPTGQA